MSTTTTTTVVQHKEEEKKQTSQGGGGTQSLAMGKLPYEMPTFPSTHEGKLAQREWMLQHMAGAFRVFARRDYGEGSAGHISVRDPVDTNTFWINPIGMHYGLLKASDMVHVDEEGNIIGGSGRAVNKAGFKIHSALHRARPDVHAACHTHSIYGRAYSAFGQELEMINQDACTFYNAHSVYDDFGGIVLESEEGEHVAKALGNKKGVILRNHGLLTVGSTVDEAAYLFTLMERSCQAQLLADAAAASGKKKVYVTDEAAQYTYNVTADPDVLYMEFQVDLSMERHLDNSFEK